MNNFDIFDYYFGTKPYTSYSHNPVKVESEDDISFVRVDVPGYKRSEIVIEVEDNKMFVKLDGNRGKKSYKFNLNDADLEGIESKLEDGILEIKVPTKTKNKKTITIK